MMNCNNNPVNCINSSNNNKNRSRQLTDHIKSLLTHRYLVIIASFLTNGIIFGVINSFGVLYVHLHKTFEGETKDASVKTSLIGSILLGTTFACSALSSIITDKCGIRTTSFIGGLLAALGMFASSFSSSINQLYLTYGLLVGFGASLCYAPSLVILGHYFTENLGLVNGIVTTGSSVFTMILPICLQQLLNRFSLSFALRSLSMLISLLMVCALTFKEKHEYVNSSSNRYKSNNNSSNSYDSEQYPITKNVNNLSPYHHNNVNSSSSSKKQLFSSSHHNSSQVTTSLSTDSSYSSSCNKTKSHHLINTTIWKNPLYILWVISVPIALFGYFVPHFHLVKHASDILPGANNELLVTCIGAASGIGRLVFGQISDIQSVNPVVLQQIALLALGGSTMLFAVARSYVFLLILCATFGLFDGCFVSLMGPVAYHLVGKEGASQAIGFVLGLSSIPFMVGPALAGYLYDLNGDYFCAFLISGLPFFIGALIMIPIIVIQRRRSSKSSKTTTQLNGSLITESRNTTNYPSSTRVDPMSSIADARNDHGDPLTESLINDHLKESSQSTNHNNLNHHHQMNHNQNHNHHSHHQHHHHLNNNIHHHLNHNNQNNSHSTTSTSHLSNEPLNFNYIKSNQSPDDNQWINNEIGDDLANNSATNCPESVSLLTKSTNQPTVISSENNDQ